MSAPAPAPKKAVPLDPPPNPLAYCCPIAYAQAVAEWHRRNGR